MTNLTGAGITFLENFDGLASSGNSSLLPNGWAISESGNNASGSYTAGTGSGNAGDTYSFGSAGSTDRALGGLFSGSLTPTIGAQFTNTTGSALTSLAIEYTGEQWRLGALGREDRLDFQISFDATSLTTGTWADVDALDFLAPTKAGTIGALDGNAAVNRTDVSATIAADVADGATFWIRWNDFNAASSDDGLAIDDFGITANPGPAGPAGPGTFSIAGASAAEGAGFVTLTVTRAGGDAGAATLDYAVTAGTANAADFAGGILPSGQVSFADGQTQATIQVAVNGDSTVEGNETFTVTLANATAGAIGTAAATGIILNDDAPSLAIYQIQGEGHVSQFAGQSVSTAGIVTGVASNGFYLQDATGDGNVRTSDAIFVFTSTAPTVAVGNEVNVTGTVAEFRPGNSAANLSQTQISASAFTVVAASHDLPEAVLIGTGGRMAPTEVFENDGFSLYQPESDAADFYESLEGMRVTVEAPLVVDRTNSFGETYVVASGGAGATGLSDRGAMVISGTAAGIDDYNPERIQLDDSTLSSFKGAFTQGDVLSDVTGIMSYDFQSYELLVTSAVTVTSPAAAPTREVTTLVGDATHVTMATYNVENLNPASGRFDILADDVVNHLRAPDIIALQEIQDPDGEGSGANLSGTVTAQGLIAAIAAIGGPDYVYIEITPTSANTTGGAPNANIRNGFLFNPDRVDYVEGSIEAVPGAAFAGSRSPVAATFSFNGEDVTAISVHSSSRGGSDALFGANQPPVAGAEAARIGQSEAIRDYVENLIGTDTEAHVAVLGDFNGFTFERSIELLEEGGLLTDLNGTLPVDERYSYMFEGNAQALDHILVTEALSTGAVFDAVHINAEQADTAARGSDHDPLVASFEIKGETPAASLEVDLSTYVRVGRFDLPVASNTAAPAGSELAKEASAITYNWDTDTLFVVGDGTTSIVEISKTGEFIGSMTLSGANGFDDIEGLAYVGNGQFVMVEERERNLVRFEYTAGGTLVRTDTDVVKLGTTTGNVGLEGVTYDPETGGYIFVKESGPQGIFQSTVDFAAGTASNGSATTENSVNLFDPAKLALGDMADVFALSNLSTIGTSERGNLIVLSQESGKILEIDREGHILSSLTLVGDPGNDAIAQQHEGVAMDKQGNLYVVSENGGGSVDRPQLWVYQASSASNAAPTAITLVNAQTELQENTSTATRLKVADLAVTDDQLGNNMFSVTGADAKYFEVDGTGLYIKAGTVLDYETQHSFSVNVLVDDATVGGTPDASTTYTLALKDVANEGALPNVFISEVAPWSSGDSPVGADWFEVTNGGDTALDITGWKVDDNSNSFANAVALSGITTIAAGQSVIFLESDNPTVTIAAFIDTWFGGTAPAGVQFGSYTGKGVGLSTDGDALNLYNAAGALQANVKFGASPEALATFNNAAGLNNAEITTLSLVGTNGAFNAVNDGAEVGSPGSVGRLVISEVAPWSSGDSPFKADWFELTNTSAVAIDITGWKVDDDSKDFSKALALNGITSIAAGESVIFVESANPAGISAAFIDAWFGGHAPDGLQIGTYTGSGIGFGTGGDAVNIFDDAGKLQANVTFGASPAGPFATFDNAAGLNNVAISELSTVGENGAFTAVNDSDAVGSPGKIVGGGAGGPVTIALGNATTALAENTATTARFKVADINISGGTLGDKVLSLAGADAQYFEVDSTGLYLKAGTKLDFETKSSYAVTVEIDDPAVGGSPDASTSYALALTDVVNEAPGLFISEVAPWSSGDSPFKADWFEVTNGGTTAINISGWKVDDDSKDFTKALALNGVTTIAPGESVIFIESATPGTISAAFIDAWFGGTAPAGLQIGTYTGGGIGFGAGGDAVNIYDAAGNLQASVSFGASPSGPFATFENPTGLNNTAITGLSQAGANGAFSAVNDSDAVGSPGETVTTNVAPIAVDDALSSVPGGTVRTISIASLLANDKAGPAYEAGQALTITNVGNAVGGTVAIVGTDVVFTATAGFSGQASFDYTVRDNGTTQGASDFLTDLGSVRFDVVSQGPNPIVGTAKNDILVGTAGDDVMTGGAGYDTLTGGAGNDILDGGTEGDRLDGGEGDDRIVYDALDYSVLGGSGNDTLVLRDGATVNLANFSTSQIAGKSVFGFENVDASGALAAVTLIGSQYSNILTGGSGNDTLSGGAGYDTLIGGAGNDVLDGGADADRIDGGAGDDRIVYDALDYSVLGGSGNDTLVLRDGATVNLGNLSASQIAGKSVYGFENVDASSASLAVNLTGSQYSNILTGGIGNDTLMGGAGSDTLTGGAGDDLLDGGADADRLDGGVGDDRIVYDALDYSVLGGSGNDTLVLRDGATVNLANFSTSQVAGKSVYSFENVDASGASVAVNLTGSQYSNILIGGSGADTLTGGGGWDMLTGGAGDDRFVFDTLAHAATGRTTITDFAAGDKIDLSGIDAIAGGADDAFSFIGSAAFSGVMGQLRAQAGSGGQIVQGDTNGDGVADFSILVLSTTIQSNVFVL